MPFPAPPGGRIRHAASQPLLVVMGTTPVLLVVYGAPALGESCMQPPGFMPGSAMGLSVAHVTQLS